MRNLKIVLVALFFAACAHLTAQDRSDLAEYQAEETACIAAHHGDSELIEECRDAVRKSWNKHWNDRFDGGFE